MNKYMILGHPGHELRAYRWMEIHRPEVFVLTNGSGSLSEGRIESTDKVVVNADASQGSFFGKMQDGDFYHDLLAMDATRFTAALVDIYQSVSAAGPRELTIVGDSIEGYNTAHDMTRYMINILCARLRAEEYVVDNFSFNLVDNPAETALLAKDHDQIIHLDDHDFQRKLAAAHNYPELAEEVEMAIAHAGADAFKTEVLLYQNASSPEIPAPQEPVYYETYGRKRVAEGKYADLILFSTHVLPFAKACREQFHASC
ncbi:MAG: hypothetical protein H7A51_11670 [Akkermansiaceae bacterium]|nr:hypothetical protein [Akkermansiaceae bacterium]